MAPDAKDLRMMDWIYRLARWTAWMGGVVLLALTLMVVASVTGRALIGIGLGPVPGDFELVEVGVAIAVFFFLPWCDLRGGHATVDVFYRRAPKWAQNTVDLISDVLMLAVWWVMTWMLFEGMLEKKAYTETTFILQMPVWWAYALCLVGAGMGCLAYSAKALMRLGLVSAPVGWSTDTHAGH